MNTIDEDMAFFRRDGAFLIPQPMARGPWGQQSINGRAIVGLLGYELERLFSGAGYLPARLTVDMHRLPGFDPIEIVPTVIRDGKRIKVIEADLISGGQKAARASCQILLKTENASGDVWSPPNWDAPRPQDVALTTQPGATGFITWETRYIEGHIGAIGAKRIWIRELRSIVDAEPLTPFSRVAASADFASPFSNGGTEGLGYINTDVTLYLHRAPVGEYVGYEVVNHHATDGIATGMCFVYDETGPIGTSSVAALAQKMKI
ncbi:MAG: thioesterase family protein [Caulobacterales bacterium]